VNNLMGLLLVVIPALLLGYVIGKDIGYMRGWRAGFDAAAPGWHESGVARR
jgi:hypothetical protein